MPVSALTELEQWQLRALAAEAKAARLALEIATAAHEAQACAIAAAHGLDASRPFEVRDGQMTQGMAQSLEPPARTSDPGRHLGV